MVQGEVMWVVCGRGSDGCLAWHEGRMVLRVGRSMYVVEQRDGRGGGG